MTLNDNDVEKIETIICYPFNKKQSLITLFNNHLPYSQQAINNGQELFKEALTRLINQDADIKKQDKESYWFDALQEYQKPKFWVKHLKKLGLNKFRNFNDQDAIDFVYCLLDAINQDSKQNSRLLTHTLNKLLYYDYQIKHDLDYNDLNWDFVDLFEHQFNLMMEIDCHRFSTYSHQNMQELWAYLYYCYNDLFGKYDDDDPKLRNVWKDIDLDDNPIWQFNQICEAHELYTGTCFLHDQYYWYCLTFVGKFKYCFTGRSEKKEEAKNEAIKAFIKFYQQETINEPLPTDPICKSLGNEFYKIQSELGLPCFSYDDSKLKNLAWNNVKPTALIHMLNKVKILSLTIYHHESNHSNCTLLVNGCDQAFSGNGMGETNALSSASNLLISYYQNRNQ